MGNIKSSQLIIGLTIAIVAVGFAYLMGLLALGGSLSIEAEVGQGVQSSPDTSASGGRYITFTGGGSPPPPPPGPTSRDPLKWPFATNSIWNMPLHNNAQYVDAQMSAFNHFRTDNNQIVMTPNAPLREIKWANRAWPASQRCNGTSGTLGSFPIPHDWNPHTSGPGIGDANNPAAILHADGRTIEQNQPLWSCGGQLVTQYGKATVDIYGDGIEGGHGGSGMSSIGGAIRVGELAPGAGPIRHSLKISLHSQRNLHPCVGGNAYRWPAVTQDSYACGAYGTERGGQPSGMKMGTLLALKPDFDMGKLQTEPGKKIAAALRDYGGYIVDDTSWDAFYIPAEEGPAGVVSDNFVDHWGMSMIGNGPSNPFLSDIHKIVAELHFIDNNAEGNTGGGPDSDTVNRRAPMAPPISP